MSRDYINRRIHDILEGQIAMGAGCENMPNVVGSGYDDMYGDGVLVGGVRGVPRWKKGCRVKSRSGQYARNPMTGKCLPYDEYMPVHSRYRRAKAMPRGGPQRYSSRGCERRSKKGKFIELPNGKCVSLLRHLNGKMRALSESQYNSYARSLGINPAMHPYKRGLPSIDEIRSERGVGRKKKKFY